MGVYKRKNGYCVKINYTDEKGNYKQIFRCNKFTKTKSEAKAYEIKLLNDLSKKVIDEKVSFDDLFNEYLTSKKHRLKNSTIKAIKTRYNLHIKEFFESMNIYSLSLKNVIHWQNTIDKLDYCVAHKNKILNELISIIKYGVNVYGINDFTSKVSKFKDANSIEKEMNYYTYDEFTIFSSNLKKWVDDDFSIKKRACYVLFNILYFAGLRIGEALALTYKDIINLNNRYFINVTKSINMKVSPYEITKPKNNSSIRKVPICDELINIINEQKEYCEKNIYGFNDDFYVCGYYEPISPSYVDSVNNHIAHISNLKHIRIHDYRHSYCSLLINGGIPLLAVSKLLGHSTIEITQKVYSHIYPSQCDEALNYLNSLNKK